MGLTWLLSLALRVLTLTEFRLRAALEQHQESVTGLNPAVPTQATARPTSERVFQTFRNLTFTAIDFGTSVQGFMTDLSPTQRRILTLLSLPADLYARLASLSP
jgi:transposase